MRALRSLDRSFERVGRAADDRRARLLLWVCCVALFSWGLRVTVLEGFVYSWPRAFFGDFYGVMFSPYWWDGTGIVYGPIFVFERWVVSAAGWVNIYHFAVLNIPIVAIAFVACARACRASRAQVVVALALWLASWPLTFALSVSANPELIEIALLSCAWLAASRGRRAAEGALVAVAALTKVIPGIFVIPGSVRPRRLAFVAGGALAATVILVIVALGQRLGPVDLARELLMPSGKSGGVSVPISNIALGSQSSPEITGLHAALTRFAFGLGLGSPTTTGDASPLNYAVQGGALVVLAVLLVWSTIVIVGLRRAGDASRTIVASYALFFALLPHATHNSHPHTWVFLVPVWTAVVHLVATDADVGRRTRYAAGFALAYAYVSLRILPAVIDRILGTGLSTLIGQEPVWGGLAILVLLLLYVRPRPDAARLSAPIALGPTPGSANR